MKETISAPGGTKFLKPDFDCVLYEETDGFIYGRLGDYSTKWSKEGINYGYGNSLTPAPQPWYEDITTPIACKVQGKKYPYFIVRYEPSSEWHLKTSNNDKFRVRECTPLTPEEVMKYIYKE